jgi:hypothetical protein
VKNVRDGIVVNDAAARREVLASPLPVLVGADRYGRAVTVPEVLDEDA